MPRALRTRILPALARLVMSGACAFGVAGRSAFAQDSVEVRSVRKQPLSISAGTAFNVTFSVKNISATDRPARVALELPTDWKVIGGTGEATVNPGVRDLLIFSVSAGRGTPAGRYAILARIEGGTADSLLVSIDEHREIEVVPLDAPGWVATEIGRAHV